MTEPPFKLGKPFVQQPRGDTSVTPEVKQRLAEECAAEIAKRRRTSTPPTTELELELILAQMTQKPMLRG